MGYKRSKSNQYPNTSFIQIEGVNTKEEVAWYLGKKMGYIYKAKVKKNGSHYRCIWGKVRRPDGNSGVVRAKFKSNLPPKSMVVSTVLLFLYLLFLFGLLFLFLKRMFLYFDTSGIKGSGLHVLKQYLRYSLSAFLKIFQGYVYGCFLVNNNLLPILFSEMLLLQYLNWSLLILIIYGML